MTFKKRLKSNLTNPNGLVRNWLEMLTKDLTILNGTRLGMLITRKLKELGSI
jgi:hypothetical protein